MLKYPSELCRMFSLFVDTSCLINYEVLAKYPISVFNLNVIINDKEYLETVKKSKKTLKIVLWIMMVFVETGKLR